jgi:hypothetical protein
MARIRTFGAECGTMVAWPGTYDGPVIATAKKRTGMYSWYTGGGASNFVDVLDSPLSELYLRIAVYPLSFEGGLSGLKWFTALSAAGSSICCLSTAPNSNQLTLRDSSMTILAYSSILLTANEWHVLEMYINANSDDFVLLIDGETAINWHGDFGGPSTIGMLKWGYHDTWWMNTPNAYWDDYAVNDTTGTVNNSFPGRGGIEWLGPEAAGDETQLTPVGAENNWDCVDERPPDDDATYVTSNTLNAYDLYQLNSPTLSGDVVTVKCYLRGRLDEVGTGAIAPVLYTNGTLYEGARRQLTDVWLYRTQEFEQNPVTGNAWTLGELGDLQLGVRVK